MKKFLAAELRRIHEEMGRESHFEVRPHRPFGDALVLCMFAVVGVMALAIY